MNAHILVVDDHVEMADNISSVLQLAQYRVTTATSGKEGVKQATRLHPDLILCDIMMPDLDGAAVFDWITEHRPELVDRLGFCTGGAFTPRSRALVERVAGRLFDKPLSRSQVLAAVEQLRPK